MNTNNVDDDIPRSDSTTSLVKIIVNAVIEITNVFKFMNCVCADSGCRCDSFGTGAGGDVSKGSSAAVIK